MAGLAVHMNQVHKENLNNVENALPNRQGLDNEIFGMEGIPEDIAETHKQRVIQQYYEDEANRRAATGNPPPGTVSGSKPKKARYESVEEMKKRLAEFKVRKARGELGGEVKPPALQTVRTNEEDDIPYVRLTSLRNVEYLLTGLQPQPGSQPFPQPSFAPPTQASPPPGAAYQQQPPFQPPGFNGVPPQGFPGAPHGFPGTQQNPPGMAELPQRPPHMQEVTASAVDDLISSVTNGHAAAAESAAAKKGKDKNTRLIYSDNNVSPEEKMARLSKYSFERGGEDVVMGEVGSAVTGPAVGPDDVVDKMG